jgi:hypothetical protein
MKPSTALRACSTLCSANWRIWVGTSKFQFGSLAIVFPSLDPAGSLRRIQVVARHREREMPYLQCACRAAVPAPALRLSAHRGA